LESRKVLTFIGWIWVLVSVGFRGRQACSLQDRFWIGSPVHGLLSRPLMQILLLYKNFEIIFLQLSGLGSSATRFCTSRPILQ